MRPWRVVWLGSTLVLSAAAVATAQALDPTLRELADVEGEAMQLRRSPLGR